MNQNGGPMNANAIEKPTQIRSLKEIQRGFMHKQVEVVQMLETNLGKIPDFVPFVPAYGKYVIENQKVYISLAGMNPDTNEPIEKIGQRLGIAASHEWKALLSGCKAAADVLWLGGASEAGAMLKLAKAAKGGEKEIAKMVVEHAPGALRKIAGKYGGNEAVASTIHTMADIFSTIAENEAMKKAAVDVVWKFPLLRDVVKGLKDIGTREKFAQEVAIKFK